MINQFGDQEAWAASFLACSPTLPASPVPQAAAIERRAQQTALDQGKFRKVSIKHPIRPAPPTTQDSPEVWGDQCLL